jgi:hypothetical protein
MLLSPGPDLVRPEIDEVLEPRAANSPMELRRERVERPPESLDLFDRAAITSLRNIILIATVFEFIKNAYANKNTNISLIGDG